MLKMNFAFMSVLPTIAFMIFMAAASASCQDLSGQWRGEWRSQTTNHQGRISATFVQRNNCQVEAKFRGTFAKIIPFRYRAKLDVVHQEPGLMVLSGSRKLGPLMGSFTYQATIQNGHFSAQYSSKRDRGQWNLYRAGY